MSCRAFSRRIEHACLSHLFTRYQPSAIRLSFAATERNEPLRGFLRELVEPPLDAQVLLPREVFQARCAPLSHRIDEVPNG
jgi:predicted enzyme involved in methoxymalonyl-ACP biosynthesis